MNPTNGNIVLKVMKKKKIKMINLRKIPLNFKLINIYE